MKLYPRKNARVMDPRATPMQALKDDGTKVNPKGFETYWYRQKMAGDVFESAKERDEAAADLEKELKDRSDKAKAAAKAKASEVKTSPDVKPETKTEKKSGGK